MSQLTPPKPLTPSEKAMKQTSKTPAEAGVQAEAPVGPNDGPTIDHGLDVSSGDVPVGEDERNGRSSPEQPHAGAKQRPG